MEPRELLTLAAAAVAFIVWLVRLEGRVNEAHRRCDDFREKISTFSEMGERVARVETKIDGLSEDIKELNANLKWLRPAEYDHLSRPK